MADTINPVVPKTVRCVSEKLDKDAFETADSLMYAFGGVENVFLKRFGTPSHMMDIKDWKKLRNKVRGEQTDIRKARQAVDKGDATNVQKGLAVHKLYTELYPIQGKHWVQALRNACSMLNSMWSNLAGKLKGYVRDNDNLTTEMKSYCYYVLSARPFWHDVLCGNGIDPKKGSRKFQAMISKLTDKEIHKCNNYLRRVTRKNLPHPRIKNYRSILCEEVMYRISEGKNGNAVISLMTGTPKKMLTVQLKSPYCYEKTGDIQIILDRDKKRLEIHKLIKARGNPAPPEGNETAPDKGYATLLSCASGNEYGKGFGILFTKESERVNKRNTERNRYIQAKKDLDIRIKELDDQISRSSEYAKIPLIREKKELERKAQFIMEHNIGNKIYNRQHKKAMARIETETNHQIRVMLKEENTSVLDKEDLTLVKVKMSKDKRVPLWIRKQNRMMASWAKGMLDERIDYICATKGIQVNNVNPAYTSQFCAECGAPLDGRTGSHHEIGICPNCGKINANTNAGKNILARAHDPEITLKTSYKEVKEILLKRYEQKLNASAATAATA